MAREQFQTLTEPMYYILLALLEECCGVDIMEKVKKISKGRVKRTGDALCHAAPVCGGGNDLSDCGGGEAQVIPDYGKGRQMLLEEYIRLTVLVEDARDYFTEVSAH